MRDDNHPRIALVAATRFGTEQALEAAKALPGAELILPGKFAAPPAELPNSVEPYRGALRDRMAGLFKRCDQIVFFLAIPGAVRLIAPHLESRETDPGVIVIDHQARFVVPLLPGRVGDANAFAERLAQLFGATPVVTGSAESGCPLAVDILGRELGWQVEAPRENLARGCDSMVGDRPVALVQEAGSRNWWTRPTPLPRNLELFDRFEEIDDPDRFASILWVTRREISPEIHRRLEKKLVVYRPPEEAEAGEKQ